MAFKEKYRLALNSLSIDDATQEKIVAEANNAFELNMQMARELEANLIQVIGKPMFDSVIQSNNPGSTEVDVANN